jgi:hypothetical protein
MNTNETFILDEIDPELGERIDMGKRNLFARYAMPTVALARRSPRGRCRRRSSTCSTSR